MDVGSWGISGWIRKLIKVLLGGGKERRGLPLSSSSTCSTSRDTFAPALKFSRKESSGFVEESCYELFPFRRNSVNYIAFVDFLKPISRLPRSLLPRKMILSIEFRGIRVPPMLGLRYLQNRTGCLTKVGYALLPRGAYQRTRRRTNK